MGKDTKIAWCDDTFNPWVGCMKISEACKHCYAAVSTPARTSRAKGLTFCAPCTPGPCGVPHPLLSRSSEHER